jgi:protoheme ferro-lyase
MPRQLQSAQALPGIRYVKCRLSKHLWVLLLLRHRRAVCAPCLPQITLPVKGIYSENLREILGVQKNHWRVREPLFKKPL